MEPSASLPNPVAPNTLRPITTLDTQRWADNDAQNGQHSVTRSRRQSGNSDISPRLVFAALRILLEHICDDELCAKRLYRCLQKKLERYFEREYTPKYDVTLMLTQELDRVICEIAKMENIEIALQRCNRCNPRILVPRSSAPRSSSQCHNFGQNYTFIRVLGEGGFGKVYHVRNNLDKVEYAVKEIPLKSVMNANGNADNDKVSREAVILAQLDHANIVRYFYAWVEVHDSRCYQPQRIASLEFPSSTTEDSSSHSPESSGVPAGVVIQEMSTHLLNPPPDIHRLRSDDFQRPDGNAWSSSWGDEQEASESASTEQLRKMPSYGGVVDSKAKGDGLARSNSYPLSADNLHREVVPMRQLGRLFAHDMPRLQSVLYIQMQLCDTSLKQWLVDRNQQIREGAVVDRKQNLNLFEQTVRGLRYIHGRGMIHRDVKPANLLLVCNPDGSYVVKLADFGLSTFALDDEGDEASARLPRRLSSRIGTRYYAAPEQRCGRDYGPPADMYSAGLILFELFQPCGTEAELMLISAGLRKDPVSVPPDFSGRWPNVAECVSSLVNKDPDKRPTAEQFLTDCALLRNWRSLKTENDSLHQRVAFLESENRDLREQLEKLRCS